MKLKSLVASSLLATCVMTSASNAGAAPFNPKAVVGMVKGMMPKKDKQKSLDHQLLKQSYHHDMQAIYDQYREKYENLGVEPFVKGLGSYTRELLDQRDHALRATIGDAAKRQEIMDEARNKYEQYLQEHNLMQFTEFHDEFMQRVQETKDTYAARGFKDQFLPVEVPGVHRIKESVGARMERMTDRISSLKTKMDERFGNGPDMSTFGNMKGKMKDAKNKMMPKFKGMFSKHKEPQA